MRVFSLSLPASLLPRPRPPPRPPPRRPPLWSDPLRIFLGLEAEASAAPSTSTMLTVHDGATEQQSEELKWIVARAQQAGCGVITDSTGDLPYSF